MEDAPVRPCCACNWLLTGQGGVGGQAAGGLAVQLVRVTVYLVLQDHPAGPRLRREGRKKKRVKRMDEGERKRDRQKERKMFRETDR